MTYFDTFRLVERFYVCAVKTSNRAFLRDMAWLQVFTITKTFSGSDNESQKL